MNINKQSQITADLQIGPTTLGMVRFFIYSTDAEVALDFTPDEADEIAEEIQLASKKARSITEKENSQ